MCSVKPALVDPKRFQKGDITHENRESTVASSSAGALGTLFLPPEVGRQNSKSKWFNGSGKIKGLIRKDKRVLPFSFWNQTEPDLNASVPHVHWIMLHFQSKQSLREESRPRAPALRAPHVSPGFKRYLSDGVISQHCAQYKRESNWKCGAEASRLTERRWGDSSA